MQHTERTLKGRHYPGGGRLWEPGGKERRGETVVLIHGLLHRGVVLRSLKRYLLKRGYRVAIYDYPTRITGIREHGIHFRAFLRELAAKLPADQKKIHVVGHSMGSLVARVALGDESVIPREKRGALIFIAAPHAGSPVAAWFCRNLPLLSKALVKPLIELSDSHGVMPVLPRPVGWRIGSVVCSRDFKVRAASTAYPDEDGRVKVSSGHNSVLLRPALFRRVESFLRTGNFQ